MNKMDKEGAPSMEAIAAVIRRGDGRFLLVRRAEGISAAGYWTTVTGKPDPGEALAAALRREVREEVGLWVRAGEEVYRCPSHDQRWMIVWFETFLDDEAAAHAPLSLLEEEVAEARWLTAAEAARCEPIFPDTRRFFEGIGGDVA